MAQTDPPPLPVPTTIDPPFQEAFDPEEVPEQWILEGKAPTATEDKAPSVQGGDASGPSTSLGVDAGDDDDVVMLEEAPPLGAGLDAREKRKRGAEAAGEASNGGEKRAKIMTSILDNDNEVIEL